MRVFVRSVLLGGALLVGASGLMAQTTNNSYNSWREDWVKAKFGRNTPMEEARQNDEAANSAFREEVTHQIGMPANTWYEQWFKMKFGRSSPLEGAR
jgi:hypothetical protein